MVDKVSAKRVGSSESSPTPIASSYKGSTKDFGSFSGGSNPPGATKLCDNNWLDLILRSVKIIRFKKFLKLKL